MRKAIAVILLCLGALLHTLALRGQTDLAQGQDIDAQVRNLVDAASQAPDTVQWFSQNRFRITPQIAQTARKIATQAHRAKDLKFALSVALFARECYTQLHNPGEALEAEMDVVNIEFTLADTPAQYLDARKQALGIAQTAPQLNRPNLTFESAVVAADCTYFSLPPDQHDQDENWSLAELQDLTKAATTVRPSSSDVVFDRFVNLLATVVSELTKGVLPRINQQIEGSLRQLAKFSEQAIPPDFSYSETQKSDPYAVQTAKWLAKLSSGYGSAAVADARLSWAASRARDEGDIESWLSLMNERYENERKAKSPELRLQNLRAEARTVAQTLRESYLSRAGRIWVSAKFDQTYGPMLQDQLTNLDLKEIAELFAAGEMLKARTLLDEMSALPTELAANLSEADELERQVLGFSSSADLQDNLVLQEINLLSQLSPFGPLGDPSNSRQKPLEQLERLHRKNRAGFRTVTRPVSLQQVKDALDPKEAMLEYVIPFDQFYPNQHLWIFLITKNDCRLAHVALDTLLPRNSTNSAAFAVDGAAPVQASPLGNLLVELRRDLRVSDDEAARTNLNVFYQILIQPLVEQGFNPGEYSRLVIVPHGPLHYVPFAALLDDDGAFLIEKTAISIAPSASTWMRLQRPSGPINKFVGFGDPALNRPDLPRLPRAAKEVGRIPGLLPGLGEKDKQVYVGEQATAERLIEQAGQADLLHIATHGEFPDENALNQHAVLLAKGGSEEGPVRAASIRKLDLSGNRLTVLSVCNGGLYRIGPADEPYGLLPAFLQAGSRNVVGTLWAVEDPYAQKLLSAFYQNVMDLGPAEALRRADQQFIADRQLIRRWAGFVVVGSGRPLVATQQ